jgi:PAS domain S-box-containing protein
MPIDFMLAPARDSAGRITHLIPSALDITERKRAEEALRESEERFRATFEQVAVGIAHVGLDGRFLRLNQKLCDIVGYSREELQQRTFMEITYAEDLDRDMALAKRLLRGEIDQYQMEKRYIHRDEHPVWINLTGAVQQAADGSPLFFIAVVEDISARKARRRRTDQGQNRRRRGQPCQERVPGQHEPRDPHADDRLHGRHRAPAADRSQSRSPPPAEMADQSAARLRALIDDILDFSRIEARKIDLAEEPFDLGACVREAVNMFALQAKKKNIRLNASWRRIFRKRSSAIPIGSLRCSST